MTAALIYTACFGNTDRSGAVTALLYDKQCVERDLTPSLPQPVNVYGLKSSHIHACKQYTYLMVLEQILFLILSILTKILSRVHAKGAKNKNGFKLDTFIGRFSSDSMAVKGLISAAATVH